MSSSRDSQCRNINPETLLAALAFVGIYFRFLFAYNSGARYKTGI